MKKTVEQLIEKIKMREAELGPIEKDLEQNREIHKRLLKELESKRAEHHKLMEELHQKKHDLEELVRERLSTIRINK